MLGVGILLEFVIQLVLDVTAVKIIFVAISKTLNFVHETEEIHS